jgi:GNAT superfamily N-acetyltransferase
MIDMSIAYRRATHKDDFTAFLICRRSLEDFGQRIGMYPIGGTADDPEELKRHWEGRRPLWEHLTNTSDQYWLAEEGNGEAIGYARSILRGDHRELTEMFVLPENQSAGVGRELIARAFPNDTPHRSVIATPDFRAMSRYLKAGVYPFLTEFYLERLPESLSLESDLAVEAQNDLRTAIQVVGEIDLVILGFRRDVDHAFLMRDRTLYFYIRQGQVIGYGYIKKDCYGPFAVLDNQDFPAVLAHAETQAHALGAENVGFEIPSINTTAIDYLMKRGYRLEGFMACIMSDKPFGKLENYALTSPPWFL